MAEALLAHALKAETGRLAHFRVISAGVAARSGDPASANSVTALKKWGSIFLNILANPLPQIWLRRPMSFSA